MNRVCLRCGNEYDLPDARVCPEDGEPLQPVLETYTGDEAAIRDRILDGRYRIEALLGEGGMGLVLRGRHLFLDRAVAIKLLHPELLLVDEVKARFLREARTASAVRHERVVEISDFGVTRQGLHYLVMEHLTGQDLFDWMQQRGRVAVRDVLRIGVQACEALAAIHRHGFVHRDLKPENVWLVDRDPGRVKLLDFGIAGVLAPEGPVAADRLTRTGRALGTPNYMAPEQAKAISLDGRADLYALGCVLWELVTGEPVFAGGSPMEVMTRQLQEIPRRPSELVPSLPSWFDDLVLRALEKAPDDRYADAGDMGDALREGLARLDAGDDEGAPAPTGTPLASRAVTPGDRSSTPRATQERPFTAGAAESDELDGRVGTGPAPSRLRARWLVPLAAVLLLGSVFLVRGLDRDRTAPPEAASGGAVAEPAEPDPRPAEEAREVPGARAADGDEAADDESPASSVVLQFRVRPEGSEVLRGEQVLGHTPLAVAVERSADAVAYTFRHAEREPLTLHVRHDRARTVDGVLAEPPPEPAPQARRRPSRRSAPDPPAPKREPAPVERESGATELMRPELPLDEGEL